MSSINEFPGATDEHFQVFQQMLHAVEANGITVQMNIRQLASATNIRHSRVVEIVNWLVEREMFMICNAGGNPHYHLSPTVYLQWLIFKDVGVDFVSSDTLVSLGSVTLFGDDSKRMKSILQKQQISKDDLAWLLSLIDQRPTQPDD